jgi:hypothetical protein
MHPPSRPDAEQPFGDDANDAQRIGTICADGVWFDTPRHTATGQTATGQTATGQTTKGHTATVGRVMTKFAMVSPSLGSQVNRLANDLALQESRD